MVFTFITLHTHTLSLYFTQLFLELNDWENGIKLY